MTANVTTTGRSQSRTNDAEAPRRPVLIAARSARHWLFKAARFALRRVVAPPTARVVALTPAVHSTAELSDLANRVAWYIPDPTVRVVVEADAECMDCTPAASEVPAAQHRYLTPTHHISVVARNDAFGKPDRILAWRARGALRHLQRLARLEIVDPEYFSVVESTAWARMCWETRTSDQRRADEALWRTNYEQLRVRLGKSSSNYVVTTGPSSDQAHLFPYDGNSVRILCNSAVKNVDLLEAARPQVLCFADPVFHFSPCQYAAQFREHLLAAVRRFDSYCVVPAQQAALLLYHYPELRDRLIGLELARTSEWLVPSHDRLRVRDTGNILTQFMIPLALSFGGDIKVIGADGRSPSEKYFWKHSQKNQMSDLMQTVVDTHPSFFRDRDYADYYAEHCAALGDLISLAERRGVEVRSLSPSFIPGLAQRFLPNSCWPSTAA